MKKIFNLERPNFIGNWIMKKLTLRAFAVSIGICGTYIGIIYLINFYI